MPAKQTNHLGAIVATLFTSLVAPMIVSLATYAIKADHSGLDHRDSSPLPQSATVWPELPPPAAVTLLPPTVAQSSPSVNLSHTQTATLARPLIWEPAN